MKQTETDEELMERTQACDASAFKELFLRHERAAFHIAYRVLKEREAARDAAQEALIRAWDGSHTYQVGAPFLPWFKRIVGNVANDHINRPATRREHHFSGDAAEIATTMPTMISGPEIEAINAESMKLLNDALHRLPESQRKVVIGKAEGKSMTEIGKEQGIDRTSAAERFERAKKHLLAGLLGTRRGRGH